MKLHPRTVFIYFTVIIISTVIFFHPIVSALSLVGALIFALQTKGKKALKFFAIPLVVGIVAVLFNVLFVHEGVTVLAYIGASSITLEAICYGFGSMLMLMAVIMQFYCAAAVLGSDELLCVFGKRLPSLSTMFLMLLMFIPRFVERAKQVTRNRKAMGCEEKNKLKAALKNLSILTTWSLESSIDTVNSMNSRAYSAATRGSYAEYFWRKRDILTLIVCALCFALCCIGNMRLNYYPKLIDECNVYGVVAIAVLAFVPSILVITEEIKWKLSR